MPRFPRMIPFFLLVFLLLFGLLFSACSKPTIASSDTLLHEEVKAYYPIGQTQRIKYIYPTRPYDTDVTIDGIGWRDGKLFALLTARVVTIKDAYSYVPMRLTPKVTFQNKTVTLTDVLWEEGSDELFKDNVYHYAVTSPDATFIPDGTLPDEVSVSFAKYSLPPKLPDAQTIPSKNLLKAEVGKVDKRIASEELTYQVTGLTVDGDKRKLSLLVTSETGNDETSKFILVDDKNRIYNFTNPTIPAHYEPGENRVEMDIVQPLPADVSHLRLVIFEAQLQQQSLFLLKDEASIDIF